MDELKYMEIVARITVQRTMGPRGGLLTHWMALYDGEPMFLKFPMQKSWELRRQALAAARSYVRRHPEKFI